MEIRHFTRHFAAIVFFILLALAAFLATHDRTSASMVTRTWDGGGVTNNWSEAANWSGDTVPSSDDDVVFDGTSTKNVVVDGSVIFRSHNINAAYTGTIALGNSVTFTTTGPSTQNGGTIEVGNGSLNLGGSPNTINSGVLNAGSGTVSLFGNLTVNGGTFNGGNASIPATSFGPSFTINGGTFIATSGTMSCRGIDANESTTFIHNSGAITMLHGFPIFFPSSNQTVFNLNLNFNDDGGLGQGFVNTTATVAGTLTMNDGMINTGTLRAIGPVVIAPTFGNHFGSQGGGGGNLLIEGGSGPRTIDLPAGTLLPNVRINDPNATIVSSGIGTVNTDDLTLSSFISADFGANSLTVGYTTVTAGSPFIMDAGTVTFTSGNFTMNTGAVFTLNNGTFTMGSGDANLLGSGQMIINRGTFNAPSGATTIGPNANSAYSQSGGVFNGSGLLDINGSFTLQGGTFTASLTDTHFGFGYFHTAGTFNHNNGTAIFDSAHPGFSMNVTANGGVAEFNNIVMTPTENNAQIAFLDKTFRANGFLQILNGRMNAVIFEAAGDVTVGAGADGDNGRMRFIGTNNQTFTNNGGLNTTGTWTVNKPAGTVTAATDMLLATTQTLDITSGTLYLANGSDLTVGPINIAAPGRLVNDSSTTITLGGNLANAGSIFLLGSGAACPGADTILIRSSSTGTRRNWTGGGGIAIVDADIQDMGGTAAITAFSSTNTGNNGANWTFDPGCPVTVSISPLSVGLNRTQTQTFTAGGGFGSKTFSIAANNSGASINSTTGLYTPGNIINVIDTVRATDAFGQFADAQVTVIPGPATKLGMFDQPPGTVTAGSVLAPAVKVVLLDDANNIVPNATNPVTVTLLAGPPSSGSILSGTLTKNAVDGISTFDDLSINRAFQFNTLQFTSPDLTTAFSSIFSVVPGAPSQLAFVTQPSDTEAGSAIAPPMTVEVRDANGNHVQSASNAITLSIDANPGSGFLSGVLTKTAVVGIAIFDGLSINNVSDGYTLNANASGLSGATSAPFNVLSPFVVRNTNSAGLSSLLNAINKSNSTAGTQTISFNLPGPGPHTIPVSGSVQPITDAVVIDGTTQPGFSGTPMIELVPGPGNAGTGLRLNSFGSTIRGFVISGFGSVLGYGGISIQGGNNIIQGNYIGTDVTGTAARPNWIGITLIGTSNNLIGGDQPSHRNIISGNFTTGIGFATSPGQTNSNNVIKGNYIGTDVTGNAPMPNQIGIQTFAADHTTIGGIGTGEGNVIAFNTSRGIDLNSTSFLSSIRGNTIHSNSGLGIDILPAGVKPNDPGDTDAGINFGQNYPVVAFASSSGVSTAIRGTLNSSPNLNYSIDFYSNPQCDSSTYGEGRTYLGSINVTTNSGNLADFNASVPVGTPLGHFITATATDSLGNTSEFAKCRVVSPAAVTISGRLAYASNLPIQNALVTLSSGANMQTLTNGNGQYTFSNVASAADYTVTPSKVNHDFTPPIRTYSNIPADQLNQNFTGSKNRSTISGHVRGTVNGTPFSLSGVTVTLSGTASRTATINGSYTFDDLQPGMYTVTAIKEGWTFSPLSVDVILTTTNQVVDLNAAPSQASPLQGRIIFGSISGSYLGSMNADGTALVPQMVPSSNTDRLDVSRDGRKIAYTRGSQLYSANSDGTGETFETIDGIGLSNPIHSPRWSPDGTRIAYTLGIPNPLEPGLIHVLKVLTVSNGVRITVPTGSLSSIRPDWIDSNKLVFSAFDGNDDEIYTINQDGTGLDRLTDNATNDRYPSVSYDGTKIAYFSFDLGANTLSIMNADGTGIRGLRNNVHQVWSAWSPNGSNLAIMTPGSVPTKLIAIDSTTGVQTAQITSSRVNAFDWAPDLETETPVGANVNTSAGGVSLTFTGVSSAGTTTVTPIPSSAAGTVPNGFVLGGLAYEITTTAVYTAPVTVCFSVPSHYAPTQIAFNALNLMHNEGGVLVNRTTSRDFPTRTICGSVTTLSPFALAEEIDATLPSITGYVEDSKGNAMPDVSVQLIGAEIRFTQTDVNGNFSFVNLIDAESYTVQPKQTGYLFSEYSQDFFALTGENSAVFTGTQANFQISGRVTNANGVPLAGRPVELEGSTTASTLTDANGDYVFNDLPADGSVTIHMLSNGVGGFTPSEHAVDPLTNDLAGLDFTQQVPTAANASISGRVTDNRGRGISRVTVTIAMPNGEVRQTLTSSFGFYRFEELPVGNTYIVSVQAKRYTFDIPSRLVNLLDNVTDADFVGNSP